MRTNGRKKTHTHIRKLIVCFRDLWTRLKTSVTVSQRGPGSVVGIATGDGLDGPRIESRSGRDFPHLSRPALWSHPASCTMGTGSFPGGKQRPGRDADPSPPSSAVGYKRVQLYLYSPLWAVRPVQSLSACTRVHFTFHCLKTYSQGIGSTIRITAIYCLGENLLYKARVRSRYSKHCALHRKVLKPFSMTQCKETCDGDWWGLGFDRINIQSWVLTAGQFKKCRITK
jgi:hypothetical protein